MEPELKPCPFCGGEAEAHRGLQATQDIEIRCKKCAASTGNYDDWHEVHENLAEAAEAWNRRAPDPVTADLLEALEELVESDKVAVYPDRIEADGVPLLDQVTPIFDFPGWWERARSILSKAKGVG